MDVAKGLLEQFPDGPMVHALMASVHYNRGSSAEAVRFLEKCLELDPRCAEAYSVLAMVAWEQGDPERTVTLCRQALQADAKRLDVYHRLGRALMDLGKTEELIETMQQALSAAPRSSQSHYLLGQGYLQSRQYAKAKQSFLTAIRIRPDHTQAHFGLCTACARLGQRDEAHQHNEKFKHLEAADRKALRDDARNPGSGILMVRRMAAQTFTGAAQIYRSRGERKKAEEYWRRAATLDPENMLSRSALVALYWSQRKTGEAVRLFEKLAGLQPDNAVNYYFLGQMHTRLGNVNAAEQAYRKMTELWPDKPHGYVMLATYLLQRRKAREARPVAARAVELEPTAENYCLLARACWADGDRAAALAAVDRALGLDPENGQYQQLHKQIQKGSLR